MRPPPWALKGTGEVNETNGFEGGLTIYEHNMRMFLDDIEARKTQDDKGLNMLKLDSSNLFRILFKTMVGLNTGHEMQIRHWLQSPPWESHSRKRHVLSLTNAVARL